MQVVPELTWAYDMGLDVDAPQQWSPRVFKAHLSPAMALRQGAYSEQALVRPTLNVCLLLRA